MRLNAQQWSDYWKNSTLTTFHGNFDNNYDGSIRQFWENTFSTLNRDAKIVDLGTGNGALALLARQYANDNGNTFQITGVDYADINPTEHLTQAPDLKKLAEDIEFISHRKIEDTQLPDNYADLVMSQFSFEYTDTRLAISEVSRINKTDGGRFVAMLHHKDSAVLQQADEALKQIRLCDHSELLPLARELVKNQHSAKDRGGLLQKQRLRAEKTSKKFSARLEKLKASRKQFSQPDHLDFFINNLLGLFNRQHGLTQTLEQRLHILEQITHAGNAYKRRMQDLTSAAVDDAKLKQMCVLFERHNYKEIMIDFVHYQNVLFGKTLIAHR